MKLIIYILSLILLINSNILAYEHIEWAYDVVEFSSEHSSTISSAKEILGEPSVCPNFGLSACAWSPLKNNKRYYEWIKVEFEKAKKVEMICINENYNQGNVSDIFLYDEKGKEYQVYSGNDSTRKDKHDGKMKFIKIKKTDYKVKYLKIQVPRKWMLDDVQIDAIGISDKYKEFDLEINIAKDAFEGIPENLGSGVNSMAQELSPIITPDGKTLYFTRDGHPQNIGKEKYQDIWASIELNDGSFGEAFNIGPPVNNESPNYACSITPDGNQMIVGNVYLQNGQAISGISKTIYNGANWELPKKIEIENFYNLNKFAEYSLGPDGKTLLMSVERDNTRGGKDLYVSFLKDDGTFTEPKNIGNDVNTPEDEFGCFISPDNETVFFASKGFPGYGDADIFMIRRLDSTWENWTRPQNIGKPVNTSGWDAYFSVPASGEFAYYVSTPNQIMGQDIYRVRIPQSVKPNPVVLVSGKVLNSKTNKPISAKIIYESLPSGREIGIAYSNKISGEYKIALPKGNKYGFLASAKGFISENENIDLRKLESYEELKKDLYLSPIEVGETVRLNNIFFKYNSSELLSESFPELNRIMDVMNEYPSIKILIAGHTDNVGNDGFNTQLSLNRAQAVKDYLISKSIDAKRLIVKGYGKKKPLADNNSDEGRQKNRRVEFTIIEK